MQQPRLLPLNELAGDEVRPHHPTSGPSPGSGHYPCNPICGHLVQSVDGSMVAGDGSQEAVDLLLRTLLRQQALPPTWHMPWMKASVSSWNALLSSSGG